jgi:hypothetical protein
MRCSSSTPLIGSFGARNWPDSTALAEPLAFVGDEHVVVVVAVVEQ